MKSPTPILHIIPRADGASGGVTDYASRLCAGLSELRGWDNVVAAGDSFAATACNHVILHYVNYGYQHRGIPFRLLTRLRLLRAACPGRFITIFHETYASGPPWKSAFWLRPWQERIAFQIAALSDFCIVSNDVALGQLRRLGPDIRVGVHPVFSNFGEPILSREDLAARDSHRWVICGGTKMIERSLRSFRKNRSLIPEHFSPKELSVFGGSESQTARALIQEMSDIRVDYQPQIDAGAASSILAGCTFAWLDYFHRPDAAGSIVLKSGVFAGCCAHGTIPIFPYRVSPILLDGQRKLPGPFFVNGSESLLPAPAERVQLAGNLYDWYQADAASSVLVRAVAEILQ